MKRLITGRNVTDVCVTIFPIVNILSKTPRYITKLVINAAIVQLPNTFRVLTFFPCSRPVNELLSHFTRVPRPQLYSDYLSHQQLGPSAAPPVYGPSSIAPPVYGPSSIAPPHYGPSSIAPPHYGPSTVSPGKNTLHGDLTRHVWLILVIRSLWAQHCGPVSSLAQQRAPVLQ